MSSDKENKTSERCVCCGDTRCRPFVTTRDYNWRLVPGPVQYVACVTCGLVRQCPLPDPAAITTFYPSSYCGKTACSRSALKRIDSEPNVSRAVAVEKAFGRRTGRLFDVGCGTGSFLAYMRERGWDVAGLDSMPENIAEVKAKLNIAEVETGLWPDNAPEAKFDVVTMFHLIEHLRDPFAGVSRAVECLNAEGLLVVETPNVCSLAARLFRSRCTIFDAPRHIYLFSVSTLYALLENAGLRVLSCRSFSPSVMEYTESLRYLIGDLGLRNYAKKAGVGQNAERTLEPDSGTVEQKCCAPDAAPFVSASLSVNSYKKQENNLLLTTRSPSPSGRGLGVRVGEAISVCHALERWFFRSIAGLADMTGYGNSLLVVARKR